MFESKARGIENDIVGGFGAALMAQDHMRPARGHGMKPQAFFMWVIRNNALVGKGIFTDGDDISFELEIEDSPVVLVGKIVPEISEDGIRHVDRRP